MFQAAKTGAPSDYGEIEETMSPAARNLVTRWILDPTGRPVPP